MDEESAPDGAVGQRVALQRKLAGLTQYQLADRAHVSKSLVCQVERGAVPASPVAAFEAAGHALADLTRSGRLERGLRAVLAHHFIFHANRAGLPAADQATLASLAVDTVFTTAQRPDSSGHPTRHH